jgi:hypothetical protein
MDPDRWFDHTEKAMLLLAEKKYARKARFGYVNGIEPVNYVRDIRQRFEAYVELGRQATARNDHPPWPVSPRLLAQPHPLCYPCASAALRPVGSMVAPPFYLAAAETSLAIH